MTFGRKGAEFGSARGSLEGYAAPAPSRFRAAEESHDYEEEIEGFSLRLKFVLIGLGAVLAIFTLDALAAGTEMITPLPEDASFYAWATGAVLGLLVGFYLWMTVENLRGIRITLGMLIGMPLLFGAWANMLLWRGVEHAEFDFSDAQWERAVYAVEYFDLPSRRSFGFSRHTVEIDPFDIGGNTDIPIPEWQFDTYAYVSGNVCVVVQQRRSASGAIQVKTDGRMTASEPEPVEFVSCPVGVAPTS